MTRVFLHIGAPKTGTTYVQHRLGVNAKALAAHGVHLPTSSRFVEPELFHFRAALDLLGQDWGGAPGHASGAWDALVKRVRRTTGSVIVSHEILAPASPRHVARVMKDLSDHEVHVVYSARDLGRQLPAAWQESIKQGRKWTFRRFLKRVERGSTWFHRAFDLPTVLSTWGAELPPERVHLVTVPQRPAGLGSDELWLRMCRAFDFDPAWAPLDSERTNRSLGIAETQAIRMLNRRMDRSVRRERKFDGLIREMLAQDNLVKRTSAPVRLPPARYDWVESVAEGWIDWAQRAGVDVIGDLADLRPVRPAEDVKWKNPDRARPKLVAKAAVDALAAMTNEAARRAEPEHTLVGRARQQARRLRP